APAPTANPAAPPRRRSVPPVANVRAARAPIPTICCSSGLRDPYQFPVVVIALSAQPAQLENQPQPGSSCQTPFSTYIPLGSVNGVGVLMTYRYRLRL